MALIDQAHIISHILRKRKPTPLSLIPTARNPSLNVVWPTVNTNNGDTYKCSIRVKVAAP